MIKLLGYLYQKKGIRGFGIVDDNFTFDKDHAESFCREVINMQYKDIEFNTPNGIKMQRGDSELLGIDAALIRKCKRHIVAITIFQPMPGTSIL